MIDMLVLAGEGVPFAAGIMLSVVVGVPLTPAEDVALARTVTVAPNMVAAPAALAVAVAVTVAAPVALVVGIGEAAGVLTTAVGVMMLVAVALTPNDGAGVPDAVVVVGTVDGALTSRSRPMDMER